MILSDKITHIIPNEQRNKKEKEKENAKRTEFVSLAFFCVVAISVVTHAAEQVLQPFLCKGGILWESPFQERA